MEKGIVTVAVTRIKPRSRQSMGKRLKRTWEKMAALLSSSLKLRKGKKTHQGNIAAIDTLPGKVAYR